MSETGDLSPIEETRSSSSGGVFLPRAGFWGGSQPFRNALDLPPSSNSTHSSH
jgi:hypothetical protein